MKPQQTAQLLRELAHELYSYNKTLPIDSPNYKRQSDLMQRAHAAADEIEGRREMATPKQLKALGNAIGGAECADNHHDSLGVALATYFEDSRYRPDNDPPCDEDGLDGWTEWVIAKTNEMLLDAAKIALARFGGGEVEIEGRQQADPGLDDLIDQAWRLHETTGYLGERFMYERDFDGAVHWVLARY